MIIPCKRCDSPQTHKNGHVRKMQRHKCRNCGYSFTQTPPRGEPMEKKLTALTLYASGLSINKIAGLLKVSPPAVLRWIRKLGSSLCPKPQPSEGQVLVMQLDEMWHYLQSKKTNSGSGRLMICMEKDWLIGNAGIVII